ncbi:chorismate mutase [Euzebya rosea]|uniref:chorismate mutase n=1 Tax=Euzebya rosea TaxID=2052804 RepID=UPI000D3EBA1D|nr:chorismate mutase [Euzebya rosea]
MPPSGLRVEALRGAITLDTDSREEVLVRTAQMLGELLQRNDLQPDDIISMLFTATADITSEFPAAAVRKAGISDVPMVCARELGIDGESNIPLCIRVMAHVYTERPRAALRHAYLRGARQLRSDLPE